MTTRIMTVYGTRPEAIKVAPLIKALEESQDFESVTVVTGQHREMLDQVNELFGIVPDHDLDIMSHGQSLAQIFSRVIEGLDPILEKEKPSAVIVQGDTSTSTAAALAAFYRQIPVVHVEAGLRSGNIHSPFPEEANRKLTTQIATLHLAPTETSRSNLTAEGVDDAAIAVTGNTVIDALLTTVGKEIPFTEPRLEELASSGRRILLVTTHRRENWGGAMEGVGRALARVARAFPDLEIVLPAHRNPIVRDAVLPQLEGVENVTVSEPLPYGEFARMMALSTVILSDSGGVQEEAPSLGKPVLVMRENTERPEAVAAGTVKLIGTEEERIVAEVTRLLTDDDAYTAMSGATNPYGDGSASHRSLEALATAVTGLRAPGHP
ncbi:non-hydrolyzing UDP-N-acetylglucosamine 2-epimerase [Cellulosimicrobium sp. I38E]|uniref:non-hydrolyzing UDP-N-acetylglucosamine 2-epimerase n=1 Tax=Cellulosimicrobium sp. I38E TaxID=1393139 RepID=UPI000B31253F|nr:UDP-N-acetylglucosamine 2-epimerase (non-hydrolyzing) [Cellulosimicrobium sp. I38E]